MESKITRTLLFGAISLLAFLIIVYFFWVRPNQQLNDTKASLTTNEFIELKSGIRSGLAQALGGAALLIGLGFTWRSIRAAEKNLIIAQENIRATQETAAKTLSIALEGQITERFTSAIEQLGDETLEVRLGGIYALERIAKDSERDYWTIIEVLTAFVREKAHWEEDKPSPLPASVKPKADVQAVLNVIKRRARSYEEGEDYCIDLSETDLRNADLVKANLRGAQLVKTHLEGAKLVSSNLEHANLSLAHCDGSILTGVLFTATTRIRNATFTGALITEGDLKDVVGLTPEVRDSMILVDMDSFLDLLKEDEAAVRFVKGLDRDGPRQ